MGDQLALRGGTTAETDLYTGAAKEVTVDTSKNTVVVHDGATAGGFPLALAADLEAHEVATDAHGMTAVGEQLLTAVTAADALAVVGGIAAANGYALQQVTRYTASGTYVKPAWLRAVRIRVVGGGGNGGDATTTTAATGGGGGGAGYAEKLISADALAASEVVTVGAPGGTSSFGAHASATGGSPGTTATTTTVAPGGAPGSGAGGNINLTGQAGGFGINNYAGDGGDVPTGLGLGGRTPSANANGSAGTGYGAGGSGGARSGIDRTGGAGTGGIVIVEEFG